MLDRDRVGRVALGCFALGMFLGVAGLIWRSKLVERARVEDLSARMQGLVVEGAGSAAAWVPIVAGGVLILGAAVLALVMYVAPAGD